MGVEQLLQMFPLEDGERTVATVNCESVGEEGEPRVPVEFVLTDRRLLAWHPRSPFALPLSEIDWVGLLGRRFNITFEGDVVLEHEAQTEELATAFAWALWKARSRKVFVRAQSDWIQGVQEAFSSFERALPLVLSAASLERYNAGVHLFAAVLSRGAEPETSRRALLTVGGMVGLAVDGVLPRIVANTDLSPLERHILRERTELNAHPELQGTGRDLLMLLDALRRGDQVGVVGAVQRVSSRRDATTDVCYFLGYLCRYGDIASAVVQALDDVERLKSAAAFVPRTPNAFVPSDLQRLADVTSNVEPMFVANRISCDWAAQTRTGPVSPRPPRSLTEASVEDDTSMLAVLTAPHLWMADYEAEVVWALVRGGRAADASTRIGADPRQWAAHQRALLPSDSPAHWTATLAATELLLVATRRDAAKECLESGFRSLFETAAQSFDPYKRNAAALFEFYDALASSDASRARMYSDHLESLHSCFAWTESVLESLHVTPPSGRGADVQALLAWLDAQRTTIDADLRLKELYGALREAVAAPRLRVVIGGETSAGKSSFINALVGDDLLFVTQEEATATPTIVRQAEGYVFRAFNASGVVDELRFGRVLTADERDECRAFVRDYTFQMSARSRGIERLEIDAPLSDFPADIEFLDTPGINGRDVLTRVAEKTIDTAHACVFLLDARNALKSSELKAIRYAARAVPKTIFVVNKMDLVLGDEELDCDASAPDEVMARVRAELRLALQQDDIYVAAVSSLSPERLRQSGAPPQAIGYAEETVRLRGLLLQMLQGARERLVGDLAARISTTLTDQFVGVALQDAAQAHETVARLYQHLPPSPATCRDEITRRITEAWPDIRDEYLEALGTRLRADFDGVFDSLGTAAEACNDMEDVQRFVQSNVAHAVSELPRLAETARTSEWKKLTARVQQVVSEFFAALYRDVEFRRGRMEAPIKLKTPLPIDTRVNELIARAADLNSNAKAKEYGPAAVGAAVGTMILPVVGSAAGYFLGKLVGSSWNADSARQLYETVFGYLRELGDKIWECLVGDVSGEAEQLPPLLAGLFDAVEQERRHMETAVLDSIRECELKIRAGRTEAGKTVARAREAWEWNQAFRSRTMLKPRLRS